jgi:hypothetical protein
VTNRPAAVRWAYVLFNASILVAVALGLLAVWWEDLGNKLLGKVFWTDLIVFAASALILAGYRTVTTRNGSAD